MEIVDLRSIKSVFPFCGFSTRPELLAIIFEKLLQSLPGNQKDKVLSTILSVCHQWKDLAIHTPYLWSFIYIRPALGCATWPMKAVAKAHYFLTKSGQQPLTFEVLVPGINSSDINGLEKLEKLILEYSARWVSLQLIGWEDMIIAALSVMASKTTSISNLHLVQVPLEDGQEGCFKMAYNRNSLFLATSVDGDTNNLIFEKSLLYDMAHIICHTENISLNGTPSFIINNLHHHDISAPTSFYQWARCNAHSLHIDLDTENGEIEHSSILTLSSIQSLSMRAREELEGAIYAAQLFQHFHLPKLKDLVLDIQEADWYQELERDGELELIADVVEAFNEANEIFWSSLLKFLKESRCSLDSAVFHAIPRSMLNISPLFRDFIISQSSLLQLDISIQFLVKETTALLVGSEDHADYPFPALQTFGVLGGSADAGKHKGKMENLQNMVARRAMETHPIAYLKFANSALLAAFKAYQDVEHGEVLSLMEDT